MDNIKISLTLLVPGAKMMSEQECSKQLKKPIINKRGKYAGKQARDKKGNLLWYYETAPDLSKFNRHTLLVENTVKDGKQVKKLREPITFYTRKNREIKQVINMTEEAYNYFTGSEAPQGYHAPSDFKWKTMSEEQRLTWHLTTIAANMGGRVASYTVFND